MKPKICAVDSCERPIKTRGWCAKHYSRWYAHGSTDKRPLGVQGCKIEGCDERHYGLGWCREHYFNNRRRGDPLRVAPPKTRQPATCTIRACDSPNFCRSMCSKHYSRWRTHGNAETILRTEQGKHKVCSIEDCDRKHFGLGWCQRHYDSFYSHGDPLARDRIVKERPQCATEGCEVTATTAGHCRPHYDRLRRINQTDGEIRKRARKVVKAKKVTAASKRPSDTCSVDGCRDKASVGGHCVGHNYMYMENRRSSREEARIERREMLRDQQAS